MDIGQEPLFWSPAQGPRPTSSAFEICPMNRPEPNVGASAFPEFLDTFFAWYYRTFPVNATFIGVPEHDDCLPDFSEGGTVHALAGIGTLLARVRKVSQT